MGDTIFALSTAPGRAGIAVIRLSGPAAARVLRVLTGKPPPPARRAALRALRDPGSGEVIDRGMVLFLPGPASFSGEDMAELHLHGGSAVVAAMLRSLGGMSGLRPAGPGEFSRRAFEAGRLDLTEIEGIADLVAAETEAQRRQAVRQLSGELGRIYEGWRGRLIRQLAHLEAAIDFPDEDLPTGLTETLGEEVAELQGEIAAHLDDHRRGERLRAGLSVAVVGPPNAGKSSLMNWLVRREAAIVSATAGTTRDVIEVHMDIGGYPVVLADTAGLREAADEVEAEGVRRALMRASAADLRILVLDATSAAEAAIPGGIAADAILVVNKADLAEPSPEMLGDAGMAISVRTGAGLDRFLERLSREVGSRMELSGTPSLTRERHRSALRDCALSLARACSGLAADQPIELVAEDLRLAARSLGRITGRVNVEDMLDAIFSEFCIGK